jgi:hypothetical protein
MNLPAAIFVLRWLIRDTFRQALATRTFWLMLCVTGLCTLFCLSVHIDGPRSLTPEGEIELYGGDRQPLTGANPNPGSMTVGFGALRYTLFRDAEAEVRFLHSFLALWVAGAIGTLAALIWTAGFLPAFLEPSAASVLLAKPAPRWLLLTGKFVAVIAFVGFQEAIFFFATWAALGLRTGIWSPGYLLCIPLLLLQFTIIYSFSALLAVYTRNTVVCVFGSLLFWFACYAMNFGRHETLAMPVLDPTVAPLPATVQGSVEVGYWIMPKPGDVLILLDTALDAKEDFDPLPPSFRVVQAPAQPLSPELGTILATGAFQSNEGALGNPVPPQAFAEATYLSLKASQQARGTFHPELSVLSSLLFAAMVLAVAVRQFATTDY